MLKGVHCVVYVYCVICTRFELKLHGPSLVNLCARVICKFKMLLYNHYDGENHFSLKTHSLTKLSLGTCRFCRQNVWHNG